MDEVAAIITKAGEAAKQLRGKRVLVTGAAGFLGQYLMRVLTGLECQVLGVDIRSSPGVHQLDVAAPQGVPATERYDYILHAAGIASPWHYRKRPLATMDAAVRGLRNMLDLANEWRARVLFFSSSEIYGSPPRDQVPTPEHYNGNVSCTGDRACYDESKRFGETLCRVYHQEFGTQVVTVRPFNVYGPGMPADDGRVLPSFRKSARAGEPLTVYGDGTQTRTYCYVTDAVAGFLRALVLGRPGEPYNIGNPEGECSVLQLARRVSGIVSGVRIVVHQHPEGYPSDEPKRRCPDISKAQLELGYRAEVGLETGLARFFAEE